jgi:hypothetical protein
MPVFPDLELISLPSPHLALQPRLIKKSDL